MVCDHCSENIVYFATSLENNFQDIAAQLQILKTLLFCLKDTFEEPSSKIILKLFENS